MASPFKHNAAEEKLEEPKGVAVISFGKEPVNSPGAYRHG